MDLEELKKQLYREKSKFEERPEAPEAFEPGRGFEAGKSPSLWQEEPQKTRWFSLNDKQKKILKFSTWGLLGILIILAGFLIWRTFYSFDKSKVLLEVFGPERIVSGEEVSYIVRYRNKTNVELQNAKLTFIFPEGALPAENEDIVEIGNSKAAIKELDNLSAGQEGQIELKANVVGLKNDIKKAVAKLEYYPANVSSSFENSAEFTSVIFAVSIVLDFNLPEQVVSGQEVSFDLKYLNTSDVFFPNLTLSLEYPEGFVFNSSSPSPNKETSEWWLPEISPREEGKIAISGTLSGNKNDIKSFKAKIGFKDGETLRLVSEGLASTLVSVSPLTVSLEVNDSRDYLANVGDELRYKVKYKNTTNILFTSVFIVLKFETEALDFATLKITKGFFSNIDNSITWNESSLPDLKALNPGEEKTLDVSLKVKENLPIKNFNDKNFLINVSAKIDSLNVPIALKGTQLAGVDSLSTKLNSKLILSAKGYFQDSLLPNSGPLPPRVGQQTTYTIYWRVLNLANDVDDVVVESYSPSYVHWLGRIEPGNSSVKYDPSTGKISWTLGKLNANTGILSPVWQLAFQVGLVPASNQIGQVVELIKESSIFGKDAFTQASILGSARSIQSDLPDDTSVGYEKGRISQ